MLIAIPEKTTNPAVLAIAFSLSSPSPAESSAGPRLFHIDPRVRVESLSSSENTNPRSINPFTSSNSSSDKLRVFLLRLKPDETVSFLTFDLGNSRYSLPERTGWSLGDPERTDLGEWVSDSNLSLLIKHCSLNDLTINKESKRLRIVSICSSFSAAIFTGDEDALGSPSPSADGPALGFAPNSVDGPVVAAASADGPAETSTTGTGRLRPSGTEENGVGPGSGTSSGRTARMFGKSASSIATSRAVLTSFCIALRPLLKAQVPNSYIRSSPTGVREIAARTASPVSWPRQV
nr:hypothetical protein Iba_chr09cCG1930 [Ipomoea batatas]